MSDNNWVMVGDDRIAIACNKCDLSVVEPWAPTVGGNDAFWRRWHLCVEEHSYRYTRLICDACFKLEQPSLNNPVSGSST